MEKINLQSNKLKLNAQNRPELFWCFQIKKLDKLRKRKKSYIENQSYNKKYVLKKKRIETSRLPSPLKTIGSVITRPLSFFDRVMQFVGVLLLGFLINRLPKIIAGVQSF